MIKSDGELVYKPSNDSDLVFTLCVLDIKVMGRDIQLFVDNIRGPSTFYYSNNKDKWYVPDSDCEDGYQFTEFSGTIISFNYCYYLGRE